MNESFMDELLIPFGSRDYCLLLLVLFFSLGMDVLSTRVATPNLELEGNPVTKFLGWRWAILVNVAFRFAAAFSIVTGIVLSTVSVLVAARNFQSAWLMRSMGEENYQKWRTARIQETPIMLFLSCLAGDTILTAGIGAGLIFFSGKLLIPLSIGLGMILYAIAVIVLTLLAVWRIRREENWKLRRFQAQPAILANGAGLKSQLADSCACETADYPGK